MLIMGIFILEIILYQLPQPQVVVNWLLVKRLSNYLYLMMLKVYLSKLTLPNMKVEEVVGKLKSSGLMITVGSYPSDAFRRQPHGPSMVGELSCEKTQAREA